MINRKAVKIEFPPLSERELMQTQRLWETYYCNHIMPKMLAILDPRITTECRRRFTGNLASGLEAYSDDLPEIVLSTFKELRRMFKEVKPQWYAHYGKTFKDRSNFTFDKYIIDQLHDDFMLVLDEGIEIIKKSGQDNISIPFLKIQDERDPHKKERWAVRVLQYYFEFGQFGRYCKAEKPELMKHADEERWGNCASFAAEYYRLTKDIKGTRSPIWGSFKRIEIERVIILLENYPGPRESAIAVLNQHFL